MFVKIVKAKEKKKQTKAFHECTSILMTRTDEGNAVWDLYSSLMSLSGSNFTLQFVEGDEAFIMNNEGVTVDRYWF